MITPLSGEEREHMLALVEDLTSGGHEKGKGKLHIISEFGEGTWCCLGRAGAVAYDSGCQVERSIVRVKRDRYDYDSGYITVEQFGNSTEALSLELQEWYGLSESNPMLLMDDGKETVAAGVNDNGYAGREYSLPEIGELFRATYLGKASKMNKLHEVHAERMKALCDDLESGEHLQGKGKLHIIEADETSYWCCLGRAAVVAINGGCQVSREIIPEYEGVFIERFGGYDGILCPELREWYGVDANPPLAVPEVDYEISATSLNDHGIFETPYDLPMLGRAFRETYLESPEESSGEGEDMTSAS